MRDQEAHVAAIANRHQDRHRRHHHTNPAARAASRSAIRLTPPPPPPLTAATSFASSVCAATTSAGATASSTDSLTSSAGLRCGAASAAPSRPSHEGYIRSIASDHRFQPAGSRPLLAPPSASPSSSIPVEVRGEEGPPPFCHRRFARRRRRRGGADTGRMSPVASRARRHVHSPNKTKN